MPTMNKIPPTVVRSTPLTVTLTAQIRIAPAATSRRLRPIPMSYLPSAVYRENAPFDAPDTPPRLRSPRAEAAVGAVAPRVHPAGRRGVRMHLLRARGGDARAPRRARARAPQPLPVLVRAPARGAAPPRRRVRRTLEGRGARDPPARVRWDRRSHCGVPPERVQRRLEPRARRGRR